MQRVTVKHINVKIKYFADFISITTAAGRLAIW